VLFTLEQWGWNKGNHTTVDFVKWVVDNGYQDVVAGFELGNETYFASPEQQPLIAANWCEIIPQIKKLMPKVELGIPIAEYFENDPDLTQVRNRMLASGELKRDTYFAPAVFNRSSTVFILGLTKQLHNISHVIHHSYGGDTPYSASYYGYKRYRNFEKCFPEIQGKKWWLSEVRERSDEDNRCQRMFRATLWKAHYWLMTIMQPEVDGLNHHQIYALTGALYQSGGKSWAVQWRDEGGEYLDFGSPYNKPRMDLGGAGALYRLYTEALKEHPLLLAHGTSKEQDTEDTFYTSCRVYDTMVANRKARKEGKSGSSVPKVKGEVEYVVAATPNQGSLCLLMVNSGDKAQKVTINVPGKIFFAPTYRTLSCPEKYLDCREVPGDEKPWKLLSWEDTQRMVKKLGRASRR